MSESRRARGPRGTKPGQRRRGRSCMSEGAQRKPHPTERRPQNKMRYRRIHNRGDARVQERDMSIRETRRQPAVLDEPRDHAVAHVCQHMNLRVVLRCGIGEHRNSEAVDDLEQETETHPSATEAKDRETQGSPWQSIPVSFLRVSRTSCGKQPHWRQTSDYAAAEYYTVALERPPVSHVAVNYHNRALEEHTKQRSRVRSSAKVTRGGRRRLGT